MFQIHSSETEENVLDLGIGFGSNATPPKAQQPEQPQQTQEPRATTIQGGPDLWHNLTEELSKMRTTSATASDNGDAMSNSSTATRPSLVTGGSAALTSSNVSGAMSPTAPWQQATPTKANSVLPQPQTGQPSAQQVQQVPQQYVAQPTMVMPQQQQAMMQACIQQLPNGQQQVVYVPVAQPQQYVMVQYPNGQMGYAPVAQQQQPVQYQYVQAPPPPPPAAPSATPQQ